MEIQFLNENSDFEYYDSGFCTHKKDLDLELLQQRIQEIGIQLEKFRTLSSQNQLLNFTITPRPNGTYVIPAERLIPILQGISGSYYLMDEEGNKKFVVKPIDEDIGCINNPKGYAGVSLTNPVRENMPLYQSALKEAALYEIVEKIGLHLIAPKTVLMILESEKFHTQLDQSKEKLCSVQEFVPQAKPVCELQYAASMYDGLCLNTSLSNFLEDHDAYLDLLIFYLNQIDSQYSPSIQDKKNFALNYLHQIRESSPRTYSYSTTDSITVLRQEFNEHLSILQKINDLLYIVNKKLNQATLSKLIHVNIMGLKAIKNELTRLGPTQEYTFSQKCYEDLLILIWITYDTDAHLGNILGYKLDETDALYGLKKIDNGLTFPTQNTNLRNPIIYYPNSKEALSDEGRRKILSMNEFELAHILSVYDLQDSIPALIERIQTLKCIAQKPGVTLMEINKEMIKLGKDYEYFYFSDSTAPWDYDTSRFATHTY